MELRATNGAVFLLRGIVYRVRPGVIKCVPCTLATDRTCMCMYGLRASCQDAEELITQTYCLPLCAL